MTPAPEELLPWDLRAEQGTARAFGRTLLRVIFRPQELVRVRAEGRVWDSLLFVILSTLPIIVPLWLSSLLLREGGAPLFTPGEWKGWVLGAMLIPLVFAVLVLVGSGLDHLVLRLLGATRGFRVTLRAHALSQAIYVIAGVPYLGMSTALIFSQVTRFHAYRGLHHLSWGRALIAALLSPVFCLLLCLAAGFLWGLLL